jgi:predicted Zn-dependent protease
LAKLDINKALNINPKNTKNLKRLANIHIMTGHIGEAEQLFQKCINLEPKDHTHVTDLNRAKTLIKEWESLNENLKKEDFVKVEEIAAKMLIECTEYAMLKQIYIKAMLDNVKLNEAINFISNKLTNDEKNEDEFKYLTALALYYDGQ